MRDLRRINGHLTSVAYPILEVAGELRESRLPMKPPPELLLDRVFTRPARSLGGAVDQAN
jgi:hypothetical protein